jgi:hypothetical protein
MILSAVISGLSKIVFMMGAQFARREAQTQLVAFGWIFLIRYHREGDSILSNIVMVDETGVSHITPKSKQQSFHRKLTALPKSKVQVDVFNMEDH